MAKQKKRSAEQEQALVDKRRRNRASRIRVKVKDGKPVTDEEKEFLAAYDAEPHGLAIQPDDPTDPDAAPDEEADADPDAAPDVPAEAPRELHRAPPPPADPLPPVAGLPAPPKAAEFAKPADGKGARPSKWQDKYGGSMEATGREQTCRYVGSLYHGVLKQCSDSLREAGIDPIINVDDESFHNAIVLAADDILPPEFTLTPTVVAVGGGSALVIQRFVKSKAIKEAQDKKKIAASSSRPVQDVAAARAEAKPEPPPPPPPPKPEPAPPSPEVKISEVTVPGPSVPSNGSKSFDRGGIF